MITHADFSVLSLQRSKVIETHGAVSLYIIIYKNKPLQTQSGKSRMAAILVTVELDAVALCHLCNTGNPKKVTFRLCHCEMKGARRLKKLFEKDGRAGPKKCRSPHATLTANMMSHGHRNAEPIVHVEQLCEQLVSSRMPFLLLENAITNMDANSQIRELFRKKTAEPNHYISHAHVSLLALCAVRVI